VAAILLDFPRINENPGQLLVGSPYWGPSNQHAAAPPPPMATAQARHN